MELVAGNEYLCILQIEMGLLGKRQVEAVITADSSESFHGYGRLVDKPFKLAGFTLDTDTKLHFDGGRKSGDTLSFSIEKRGIAATFTAQADASGTLSGRIEAGALLKAKVKGQVVPMS